MGWVLAIIFLVVLVFLGFDYFDVIKTWIDRIKIGRVTDNSEWESLVKSVIFNWLVNSTPELPKDENKKFKLIDKIKKNEEVSSTSYWQDAAVVKALTNIHTGYTDEDLAGFIEDYIDAETGEWKPDDVRVDSAMLCYELLCNDKIDKEAVKPAMDYVAGFLKESAGEEKLIPYSEFAPDMLFVDTIGLVCPFLIKYAIVYDSPEYIEIAINQIKQYHVFGFDKETRLPFHCYNKDSFAKLGVSGWGRGCAWWAVGLVDSLFTLLDEKKHNPEKAMLLKYIIMFLEEMLKYQCSDGSFGRFVQIDSQQDSSAAAMLAYCYAKMWTLTEKDNYREAAEKVIEHLKYCTRRNGVIDYSQGDTKGIGFYSDSATVVPAAQGFAVAAVEILSK